MDENKPDTDEFKKFVRHLAHEINNSLSVVRLVAEEISDPPPQGLSNEKLIAYAQKLDAVVERIALSTKNLREVSIGGKIPEAAAAQNKSKISESDKSNFQRILIVDDAQDNRDLLQAIFKSENFEVIQATDAAIALRNFKKGKYQAVVTGLNLPGISGIEFLKQIKAIEPDLPVFFISGDGNYSRENLIAEGATDFFLKPIHVPETKKIILNAIQKRSLQKQTA